MVQAAFDFSEKYRIPVLMRLTTRMAHSRAMVEPREARPENSLAYPARTRQWVLMPGNSRVRYEALLADYARFEEEAAASPFNRYADAEDKSLGIIACGIAYNYLAENYPDGCPHPVLKISQYPLPQELVRRMASECKAPPSSRRDNPSSKKPCAASCLRPLRSAAACRANCPAPGN